MSQDISLCETLKCWYFRVSAILVFPLLPLPGTRKRQYFSVFVAHVTPGEEHLLQATYPPWPISLLVRSRPERRGEGRADEPGRRECQGQAPQGHKDDEEQGSGAAEVQSASDAGERSAVDGASRAAWDRPLDVAEFNLG